MTETPERPSTRRAGEVEEQETLWAPSSYAPIDAGREGRWSVIDGNAVVWTDDDAGAGVTWLTNTALVQRLWRHFMVAKDAGTPAGVAYQLALSQAGEAAGPEEQGPLQGMSDRFDALIAGRQGPGGQQPAGGTINADEGG